MRNVAISVGVLVLILVIWVATRKPPSIDDELGKLPADERQALESITAAVGLTPAQLRPVGAGVLQYNPKAVAVQEGHVVELRLADAPIKQLDAVSRLSGLRVLWFDGSQLASLQGIGALKALRTLNLSRSKLTSLSDLAGHPSLERLNLAQSGLSSVADLRDLPKLEELDLSGNQLADVGPLATLPALSSIDLTGNPIKALPSNAPARWKVKSDMAAAAPAGSNVKKPDNWADALPKANGQAQKLSRQGQVTGKDDFKVDGAIQSLKGAVQVFGIPGTRNASGDDTVLEIEVQSGKVRGYLEHSVVDSSALLGRRHGFVYGEAAPGKPGRVVGMLTRLNGSQFGIERPFEFVIESLEGEATGITFKLHRNPKSAP